MYFSNNSKIEKLYYMYRDIMYTTAYEILQDNALSEDAVSESFVRIKIYIKLKLTKAFVHVIFWW